MRTTVELPVPLLRAAKARAAERGEALKTLFTRAVTRELGQSSRAEGRQPAAWPLVGSARKGTVHLTNDDLVRLDDSADVAPPARATKVRR